MPLERRHIVDSLSGRAAVDADQAARSDIQALPPVRHAARGTVAPPRLVTV